MTDGFGRTIDYMRVSLTDRCNLRCGYCMPEGAALVPRSSILSLEETLRICQAAISLGITKFKVTGGEPLVRRGCADFIARLKKLPGAEQVTMTTNGLLLKEQLEALSSAGIDGINISIDSLDNALYRRLTGLESGGVAAVLAAVQDCTGRKIKTKINAVLLEETFDGIPKLARLAAEHELDVRFIELMPIGEGVFQRGVGMEAALEKLKADWPDLHPVEERRGNGPARYYAGAGLKGRIGFIDAMSHGFCGDCNRVRLTASGLLKPCLCYEAGVPLGEILRGGGSDEELREAMEKGIAQKPRAHCFLQQDGITERQTMNQIGG